MSQDAVIRSPAHDPGRSWVEETRIIAADGAAIDQFGWAVALDGDTALVAAQQATVGGNFSQGAVYVFIRGGGGWSEQAKLTAADGAAFDQFGWSVALDGDTALIGANLAGVDGNPEQGAVYVFTRTGGESWSQQAKLIAGDGAAGDQFGYSVALDGDTAVVGASTADVDGQTDQGATYVFTRSGESWSQQARLTVTDGLANDQFGWSVGVAGDTALVAASDADVGGNVDQGAAYVFTRSGETWSTPVRLTASDGAGGDQFGYSAALDGDTALVGARRADFGGDTNPGAAYVFTRGGDIWSEQTKLTASDAETGDLFGSAVALDGNAALVTASQAEIDGNVNQGAAYVFARTGDAWSEAARLTSSDGAEFDFFGISGAVAGDTVLVGAPGASVGSSVQQGKAYVFVDLPADVATIEGTVRSLDLCETDAAPLGTAGVEIIGQQETYALAVDEDGFYRIFLPESESPVDITVTAPDHLPAAVEDVTFSGGEVVMQDFDLILEAPCATADPAGFSVELDPDQSVTETLTLGNVDGAAELSWTIVTAEPSAVTARGLAAVSTSASATPGEPRRNPTSPARGVSRSRPPGHALGGDGGTETATDLASLLGETLPGLRPIRSAGGGVDCDAEPGILLHDDGTVENGYSGNPTVVGEVIFVDRFTPGAYPAAFHAVCLAFLSSGPTSLDFEIVVVDDDGPGGAPGTELGALPVTADGIPGAPGQPVWFSFDISSLGITVGSGSVYFGARWVPATPNVFIAADESPGNPVGFARGYWWNDNDGVWAPIQDTFPNYRALFVRAIKDLGGCDDPAAVPWLSVTPDAGSTPPGGSTPVDVTLDATGLEAGEHRASLCVATNGPGNPLIAIPVTLTVTSGGEEVYAPMALVVDPEVRVSDGNGVFEPNELIDVAPAWRNDGETTQSLMGTASDFTGPEGAIYALSLDDADYGIFDPGQTASCLGTGVCYQMEVDDPIVRPAPHWEATFDETLSDSEETTKAWTLHIGDSFVDVPRANLFYPSVETLLHHGVTGGCTDTEYCPTAANTRDQMPVFVLRAVEGADYQPPACAEGAEVFHDVPASNVFCPWIEELANRGVVSGCGGENYCPNAPVTRAQMAIFLLRSLEGSDYTPPACTGQFVDVPCPSLFADWVEDLFAREITGGCSDQPLRYCPANPVNREQMAVFVTKAFGLTLYGP